MGRVLLSRTRALSRSISRRADTAGGGADVSVATSSPLQPPTRATSWKVKPSIPRKRLVQCKDDLVHFAKTRGLNNVRESKLQEFFDSAASLCSVEFDNKSFSMDEIQLAAFFVLERHAPYQAFADKTALNRLFGFVEETRAAYKANPYHDFRHAFDVMQFMNFLLSKDDVAQRVLPAEGGEEVRFMMLVACLCHDAGHDGSNNTILRKTKDALVEKFGPESTLERLHSSLAVELIEASKILECVADAAEVAGQPLTTDADRFLDNVRGLILATDMEKHSLLLSAFKASPSAQMLNVLIKVSDISNVVRQFDEAKTWANRLAAEQRLANTRLEGIESVPDAVPLAASVISFSKIFALPLIDALIDAGLPDTGRELRARIEKNISMWESMDAAGINPGL